MNLNIEIIGQGPPLVLLHGWAMHSGVFSGLAERLHQSLTECVARQEALGQPAVLLVPGPVRPGMAKLLRHSVPSLCVLAYGEVPEDRAIQLLGTIQ